MEEDTAGYGFDPKDQASLRKSNTYALEKVTRITHRDLNTTTSTEVIVMNNDGARMQPETESRQAGGATVAEGVQPTRPTADVEAPIPAVTTEHNYSDLPEVVQNIPASWDLRDNKMPVITDKACEKIAAMNGEAVRPPMLSPSLADPVPAYPHALRSQTSNLSSAPLAGDRNTPSSPYDDQMHAQDGKVRDVKVCGMGSRMFMCVAMSLLVFVLVLLAVVLGVTLTMKKSHPSDAQPVNASAILTTTHLAAVNWTDTSGIARSAVFYQGSDSAILLSLRDSISNEWIQSNITKSVLKTSGADTLDVQFGTPLAAVTNSWQVSLYYLTKDNHVAEVWASDVVKDRWFAGELATRLSPRAMNGSKLSAFWQTCPNCTNSLFMTYQELGGSIQICNLTNKTWEYSGPIGTEPSANGTGLAIRPFTDYNGAGLFRTNDNALRLYHVDPSGKLLEMRHGPETNFTWVDDSSSTTLSSVSAPVDPSLGLASVSYGQFGWTKIMVLYRAADGNLTSNVWNETTWSRGTPRLSGGPLTLANFSAIATAQDHMVYGFSKGVIYQYRFDESDPLNWIYASNVTNK